MNDEQESLASLELLDKISGERVKKFATELSKIEMRTPGSENERKAADRIADEMRNLGLEVSLEEYEAISWEHGPAQLKLTGGQRENFDIQFMPYSPSVPEKGAKGSLISLKFGFPKEYEGIKDSPVIVIADWNQDTGPHFQMLAAARSGKKVVAFGLISSVEGAYRVDAVPILAKTIPFPVFSLTPEDGKTLREICNRETISATLTGKSRIIPGAKSANVIGTRKGRLKDGLRLIVSGHHDGWFAGANDNLSAVAAVIETARALVDADIDRSIDFISFGCEEAGSPGYQYYLWGSRQYIKKHKGDIGDIACILNCELAGHSNSNHLVIDCTPDLVSFFETISEDLSKHIKSHNLKASIGIAVPTSSQADQLNFSLAGVPSSLFNWAWYDEYHSNIDTADRLETSKLKIFCKLLLLSAYRISTTNKLPLSLTRYARILKMGHKGISSHLSPDIMEVHASGIEHLKRIGGDTVNFDMALRTLEEFARTAAQFEREFARTDDEGSIARMNRILLDACSDLNSGLCKSGGLLGEDSMFPGYMEYVEELRKISEAVNSIARVKGSDMPDYVLTEFVPIRSPEISCKEFDVHKELNLLNEKRDKLAQSIQREIDRINSIIMAATKKIERQA